MQTDEGPNSFAGAPASAPGPILKRVTASEAPSFLLIPDLHGHGSRLQAALAGAKRFPKAHLVFLGDLIDDSPRRRSARNDFRERGAPDDSRAILGKVKELHAQGKAEVLLGNHEVMACSAVLDDHHEMLELWWAHGGRETAASYGWRVNTQEGPLVEDLLWLREHARLWLPVGLAEAPVLASHATRPAPRRMELGLNLPRHLMPAEDFDPVVWFPLTEAEIRRGELHALPVGFTASVHGHMEDTDVRQHLDAAGQLVIQLDLHPKKKKLAMLHLAGDGKRQVVTQTVS